MRTKSRRWGINRAEWASPEGQEFSVLETPVQGPGRTQGWFSQTNCLCEAPVSASWSWGDWQLLVSSPYPHPVPPPLASVFWRELCEAEDNLGLISVPGRHVTCVAGTQTARVLAANSSREKTEELSHLIMGNGPLCVCDSVRLSDRF